MTLDPRICDPEKDVKAEVDRILRLHHTGCGRIISVPLGGIGCETCRRQLLSIPPNELRS